MFVLMLLWCGELGLYPKVHSHMWSLLYVSSDPLVNLSTTFLCLADCYKVCSFVEAAFVIKDGPFIGVVTDQFPFQIMGIIALLVTNIVATLMIVYKTWYHIC